MHACGCAANTTARIVLFNEVGSAGKGSIARVLQTMVAAPLLHVQIDTFMAMLPEAYHDHPDGFSYGTVHENGKPLVVFETGPVGERTLRGMRHAVAAMARQGNDLIVDDVTMGTPERTMSVSSRPSRSFGSASSHRWAFSRPENAVAAIGRSNRRGGSMIACTKA